MSGRFIPDSPLVELSDSFKAKNLPYRAYPDYILYLNCGRIKAIVEQIGNKNKYIYSVEGERSIGEAQGASSVRRFPRLSLIPNHPLQETPYRRIEGRRIVQCSKVKISYRLRRTYGQRHVGDLWTPPPGVGEEIPMKRGCAYSLRKRDL